MLTLIQDLTVKLRMCENNSICLMGCFLKKRCLEPVCSRYRFAAPHMYIMYRIVNLFRQIYCRFVLDKKFDRGALHRLGSAGPPRRRTTFGTRPGLYGSSWLYRAILVTYMYTLADHGPRPIFLLIRCPCLGTSEWVCG